LVSCTRKKEVPLWKSRQNFGGKKVVGAGFRRKKVASLLPSVVLEAVGTEETHSLLEGRRDTGAEEPRCRTRRRRVLVTGRGLTSPQHFPLHLGPVVVVHLKIFTTFSSLSLCASFLAVQNIALVQKPQLQEHKTAC